MDLVVDAANTVGARPDGWWRDRAGAATRLLAGLARLADAGGATGPDGRPLHLERVHAVLEGAARSARPPAGAERLRVVLAPHDGDTALADLAAELVGAGTALLVVTADRGLRARLPDGAAVTGPGWLRDVLDELTRLEQPEVGDPGSEPGE